MARITRALLQKRSEHNENIVRTLREVSLHQQKLESIDACLQRDCRELRILLLHDNQIRKLGECERETFFCGCVCVWLTDYEPFLLHHLHSQKTWTGWNTWNIWTSLWITSRRLKIWTGASRSKSWIWPGTFSMWLRSNRRWKISQNANVWGVCF